MHTARAVHLLTLALTLTLTLTLALTRAVYVRGGLTRHLMHITQCATVRLVRRLAGAPSALALALTLTLTLSRCTFCPCGAVRFSLHGATLRVNGREVMVLHRNLMCQWPQPSVPVAATLCAGSCNSPSVRHWPQAAAPRLTAR